jgi:hypothetical protein
MFDIYHIRVTGHLESHWSAWFENMTITNQPNGQVQPIVFTERT